LKAQLAEEMTKKAAGTEIERLIGLLARLPGLGHRSARKAALALIKRRADLLEPLAAALNDAAAKIVECSDCGNLDTVTPCTICRDPARDRTMIVAVEEIGDLWALERAGVVKGLYHVLGGHLSPLDGIGPDRLNIAKLIERAAPPVKEVLLALNATVEGQSTARRDRDAPCARRADRRRARLPRRGHSGRRHQEPAHALSPLPLTATARSSRRRGGQYTLLTTHGGASRCVPLHRANSSSLTLGVKCSPAAYRSIGRE